MKRTASKALFRRAEKLFPGGVNSPVRAFKAVGGDPLIIARGEGPYMVDVDGNRFIDYVLSWGPMILGHAHPKVTAAIIESAKQGTSFGAPNRYEIEMGELVRKFFPNIEMMRLVNSGTEATLSALRLSRAFTGREKVLKFEGCYHGHADSFLVKAGSGLLTLGIPSTPGVPKALAKLTLTAPFNDEQALKKLFATEGKSLAAVIIEPVVGNSGVVPPAHGFLQLLRKLCTQHGTVLIFDEVMTGFRVSRGGAQERYKVKPDLTTFGKVIGGGMPVGAYGGRKDIMRRVAPSGDVYQAGTLSGNPVAMAAGLATLRELERDEGVFERIEKATTKLATGLLRLATAAGIPAVENHVGSMFTLFFTQFPVQTPGDAMKADAKRFGLFFNAMLERGVYLPPSQYEAAFLSAAHDEKVVAATLRAAEESFAVIRKRR